MPPRPFAKPDGVVEVTLAEPASAEAVLTALAALGVDARGVDLPTGRASAVLFTEGLAGGAMTARHWSALKACVPARAGGASLIFLQQMRADTGIEGLARTLRREWTEANAACWTLAGSISGETICSWLGHEREDLWLSPDGSAHRMALGHLIAPCQIKPSSSGTWLITGGARGVTAACAIGLARQSGGTFILAGRSAETPWPTGVPETTDIRTLRGEMASAAVKRGEKPSPAEIDKAARAAIAGLEIRKTLTDIRAAGAIAHYLPMDTSDPVSVASGLSFVQQQFGPITGLVHGAGVIADRLVEEKTEDELARVFAPKAEGLACILSNLDRVLLRHVGLFSSASAFFGNRGQSDYAMANAILANTARALAAELPAAQVKVFDWGPWEGGMVDATLAEHFRQQGVPLIPLAEGARIFAQELLGGDPADVELVIGTVWSEI